MFVSPAPTFLQRPTGNPLQTLPFLPEGGRAPTIGSLWYCTIPVGFLNPAHPFVNSSFIKLPLKVT